MHCITIQLPTHVNSFVLSVGVCSKHASHCGADTCLALVRRRLDCLCWRGECIIQMWLTLRGGRGRGGDALKVEGLMMMPVRKQSALSTHITCWLFSQEHFSTSPSSCLSLIRQARPEFSLLEWCGWLKSFSEDENIS